ncbi:hypothetical protein [Methylobacterium iners]|uniref:NIPSNAP domain-containing protein n=1 Tax=Methylobacterium iners TaxID=418707 RepID=A0ABQ4RYT1_9HYPH|nr:hypothetical protein [Methylobacterium iners]GJD94788.1 hypothetical protein OCOJLMKI_1992 [Methylobacterium iners]
MARLKITDVKDRGFALYQIWHRCMAAGPELIEWYEEQGFRPTERRIGSAWWVVFDTPDQALHFKMRWL